MYTGKIDIKPYLAQYCQSKFATQFIGVVKFPSHSTLAWLIYTLSTKRPKNKQTDSGNLEFILPQKRERIGVFKNPATYNYFTKKSQTIIQKYIYQEFWIEAHAFLNSHKMRHGIDYQDSAYLLLKKYDIDTLTTDALSKSNYRYRKRINEHRSNKELIFC